MHACMYACMHGYSCMHGYACMHGYPCMQILAKPNLLHCIFNLINWCALSQSYYILQMWVRRQPPKHTQLKWPIAFLIYLACHLPWLKVVFHLKMCQVLNVDSWDMPKLKTHLACHLPWLKSALEA